MKVILGFDAPPFPPLNAFSPGTPQVYDNCLEIWGWYWVIYNRAMLQEVDGWYRVEDTPPSKVRESHVFLPITLLFCASRGMYLGPRKRRRGNI